MLSILRHRVYRHLFAAQVISLLGTGLATVALSLMAFELAGDNAGTVLATALTIKMLAYVFVSPLLAALFQGRPRKPVLVLLDIIRARTDGAFAAVPHRGLAHLCGYFCSAKQFRRIYAVISGDDS